MIIVGNTILLPLVIAVFVCYLINALAAVTRNIRIFGRALPNSVRLTGAIVVVLLVSWYVDGNPELPEAWFVRNERYPVPGRDHL